MAAAGVLAAAALAASTAPVTLIVETGSPPAAVVNPWTSLGAGVDGVERGGVARLFTPRNIALMRRAGFGPLTYRLRTELANEAWHWTEEGRWSDSAHRQGYWTSSARPKRPVLIGWGYRLPRRGNTIDQGSNRGWSRIDDGDETTFWKSSPYLDRAYAGEDLDQWVVVDLGDPAAIDTARIAWARPYATAYAVQYWTGVDEYDDEGRWVSFPGGEVADGQGGLEILALAKAPIRTEFVRLLLRRSSGSAPPDADDPRDRMGYAVAELGFGRRRADGTFEDAVRHGAGRSRQSMVQVSSTDPWHRASDRDPDLEQVGFDRLFASGLTNGQPVMIPVGAFYDTPENARAELRFLKWRGYPVRQVEIGEEPDGQNVTPEHFAALYAQFASVAHQALPGAVTGGPSLQSAIADTWLDEGADHSWTRRFIDALGRRGAAASLGFFSFEHYPFDDLCGDISVKLVAETDLLPAYIRRLRDDHVPPAIPWVISEYGFSAFGGRPEVELPGALINAEIPAQFLKAGGAAAYLFGYGPNGPYRGAKACAGFGNLMLYEADGAGAARWPMPSYWAARMVVRHWLGAARRPVDLLPTSGLDNRAPVAAFAARPRAGRVSVLLLNRGRGPARLDLAVRGGAGEAASPARILDCLAYDPGRYAWMAAGPAGHPVRDHPPRRCAADPPPSGLTLPGLSLMVIEIAASQGPAAFPARKG